VVLSVLYQNVTMHSVTLDIINQATGSQNTDRGPARRLHLGSAGRRRAQQHHAPPADGLLIVYNSNFSIVSRQGAGHYYCHHSSGTRVPRNKKMPDLLG
jgi:hypothetical protein